MGMLQCSDLCHTICKYSPYVQLFVIMQKQILLHKFTAASENLAQFQAADVIFPILYIRDVNLAARRPDASHAGLAHPQFSEGGKSYDTSHDDNVTMQV